MAKSSYLSNVLKSIKYATIDVVAEMNPVIVDTYRTNKDFVKDSIADIKQKAQESSSEKKNAISDTIKTTYSNLKDDLKTGNFYNKARIEEAENKAMEKAFGISLDFDMGDDDSDGGNFDFGDAFEEGDDFGNFDSDDNETESSSSSDPLMAKTMATAMGYTNSTIARSSAKNATAISGTLVETSKFNADVIALSTEKMMGGVAALGGSIHTDLTAINANLASIVTFTDEAFRTHIENSSTFFETQKQQMQEQTDILKEILDLQKSVYRPEKKTSDKVNISDIFTSEGGLDLSAYKDYIKQNSGGIEGTSLGMFSMITQFAPMIMAGFTGSPLSVPLKMLIKKTIPETLENAFDSLNKTIAGSISTALVNLTQAKKGHNGSFFQFLGDMFGLSIPKLEMDLGAYNKGAVSWTGKDHKALTDVIPTWLSKIYSGITGKEGRRYDYEKGKFVTISELRKQHKNEERTAVAKANYGVNQELNKMMAKLQLNNEVDRQKLLDVIEKIEKQNFTQMKNFNPNSKKDQDPATYDIKKDEEPYFEIYKLMMKMMPPKTLLNGSRELLDSISDYNRVIREREQSGESAFNALFNNSIDPIKIMDSPIMASAKRLDITNNLLQDILSAVTAEKVTTTKKTTSKTVKNTSTKKGTSTGSTKTSKEEPEVPNTDIGVYEERLKSENVPEAVTEEQQLGYIEEIRSKQTASEKIKSFFGGINRLMKKPMEFVTSAVGKIDKFAYTMFFGNGEEDINSISKKLIKGFDDMFAKIHGKITTVFDAVKAEFKKEGGTSFNGLFKAVFGVDLKAGMDDFKEAMFGDKDKSFFSGMGEVFGKGLKEITHDVFGGIKDSIRKFFKGDNDKFDGKEFTERMIGNASAIVEPLTNSRMEEEKNKEAIKDLKENGITNILDTTGLDALKKQEKKEKMSAKKKSNPPKAAKGMRVTKTGLVAVSAGERIIPKYRNQASIDSRALHENTAINKFKNALGLGDVKIDSFAEGTDDSNPWYYNPNMTYEQFNKFYNTLPNDEEKAQYTAMFARDFANRTVQDLKDHGVKTAKDAKKMADKIGNKIKKKNPALYDAFNRQITNAINSDFAKNVVKGAKEVGGFVGQVGQEAKKAGTALYDAFTEKDGINDSLAALAAKFTPGKKEKAVLDDITNNWKKYLPKTLAGGALGAGFSTILGLMGGPLLGAAVGAAVSLTTKSDAIQKWLFGDAIVNEDGKIIGRTGGIFSKDLATNIQNLFPDMAKGGIIGAISSVLPFVNYSPITGILLGSAVGYARKSQFFQDEFFGKDTNLGKAKDFVAKQLPKMGLGAAVAGLAGPFGLTTNLILGASLGLVSDTEEFKGMIFGTEDVNGKRHGGMVGFIRKTLELPLQGLQKMLEETTELFRKEIIAPIKFAAKTVITQFQNMFLWVGDRIADSFAKHVWNPIGTLIADKIVIPIEKKLGKVINGVFGLAKKAITAPFRAVGALARPLRRRQLSVVGGARGTASDRIIERQEIIEGYEERARNAKTQWGRNRLKKRAEKVRNQFSESESAKADEFAGGLSTDELRDALLVNKAIGPKFNRKGATKAIAEYTEGTFVTTGLNKRLNSYVSLGLISNKERKAIDNYVRAGNYKAAQKIVNRSMLAIGQNGRPEDVPKLNKEIKQAALAVREGKKKAENASGERDRIKQATGIDISGMGMRRVLEKELHARGESSNIVPGEREDANLNPTEKFLSGIYTDVHSIADRLIGRDKERKEKGESYTRSLLAERERSLIHGPIYDANDTVGGVDKDTYDDMIADFSFEELNRLIYLNSDFKKYEKMGIVRKGASPEEAQKQIAEFRKSFGYTGRFNTPNANAGMSEAAAENAQATMPVNGFGLIDANNDHYEYTENGMVKIRTNEQGELEPDMRDSETRDTVNKKKENDVTQKGILSKLTGIGTSITDFFTGKDEKKEKKSIFSKILGVLAKGFAWFGGSKLATALKVIGGGALGAFVLGRNTSRVKTDKNGKEIYDEDGNVQYMTIGDCIIDGIGYMLFGKAGKGGLIGFWTGTVFPGLKDFTINTLIPGIENGLHWIWDNIVLLLPKIGNWVLNTGIPGVWKGIEWAADKLVGIGETVTTWVTDSLLPAVFEKLPTYINKAAGGLWNALLKALGIKTTEDPEEKKDSSTNKRYQNTEKPKEVKESDVIPNDTIEVNTGGTATLFGNELKSNSSSNKVQKKGSTQYYGYSSNINNNSGTAEKTTNNAYISNPYVSNTGNVSTYDSGSVANYNQNTSGQPGTFVGIPENYYRSTNTTALGISDATQAVQGLTKGQMKDALYTSDNYKGIENENYKKRLWENDTLYEKWNTVYETLDGQFTLGQILTTPGIRVMTDSYGKTITSDQIIKSPDGMNEIFGINAVATNGEIEANTTHHEHTPLQNTGKALGIAVFNKGKLPNTMLRAAEKLTGAYFGVQGAVASRIPILGRGLAAMNAIQAGVTTAPMKITEFANNFMKNRNAGKSVYESLTGSARSTFKQNLTQRIRNKKGTGDKIADAMDKLHGSKAGKAASGVMEKIKKFLTEKLTDNDIISAIAKKINKGVGVIKGLENVGNEKLKKLMLDITAKIMEKLSSKTMQSAVASLGTKIAGYMGTAGVQLVATAVTSFIFGFKNADANFGVEEATLGERLISGIVNMISKTLLFGIFDTQEILSVVTNAIDGIIDMSDLRDRQEKMQQIVDQYNDENETNFSVYDYLMEDKIETKINKFLHSRGLDWATSTVQGVAEGAGGAVFNVAAGGVKGALGIVTALPKSAIGAFNGEGNFFKLMGSNIGGAFKSVGSGIVGGVKSIGGGLATIGKGFYHTFTGKTWDEAHDNGSHETADGGTAGGKGGSFGLSDEAIENAKAITENALNPDTASAEEKTLDLVSSQFGLSTSDYLGETADYKEQADKNREAVANLNSTWTTIGDKTNPFLSSILGVMDKAMSTVSKNIAVSLGLADAEDENVDLVKILNDDQYLQKRAEIIQQNSVLAGLFGGVTGSNSNNSATQESAAMNKYNSPNTGNSTSKAVNKALSATNTSSGFSSSKNPLKYSNWLWSVTASGKGSGVTPTKDYVQVNPAEATFVSQKYGSYANQTFGSGNNKQKVSEAGCAPSTAVMALNSNIYHETDVDMKEALRTASGYVAGNGGVTADYFADEFSKHGFKAAYVPKSDKKQKEVMMHQLNNGRSIILMGRDTKNTSKKKSPFGPNFHYVVATGMSADGKYVYINDPESDTPNKRYDADVIFNNTDLTIVPIKTKNANNALSTKVRDQLKKLSGKAASGIIFVGDSRTVGLENAIKASITKKFVAKSGSGYAWLSKNAYNHVKTYANKYKDYAIVFNFGVNDLGNISSYINFYKKVVATYGDRVYFMSVNPVNQSKYKGTATNKRIDDFNKKYKAFAGNRYIDTCTYMRTTGFESPDGLHYSTAQYKKIYDFVVDFINQVTNKSTAAKATNTVAGAVSNASDLITSTATDDTTTETTQTATNSRKHIRSISDLISAISSILSGSYMLSTSDYNSLINGDGTDGSSGTTTINTDGISGRVSSDPNVAKIQKELVAKMYSIKGKIDYSQSGPRNPDKGSADCSSTVQWAYRKITGKDIGSWTGAQETNSNTKFIDQPHNTRAFNENKLQLGDILLYGNNANDHVEMYAGNGQVIGHGSGKGPKVRSMGVVHPGKNWSAKRLANFNDIAGKGSGIFVSQKSSQWANKKIGDERVSEAGCAPAVATMAIDNTKSYNMNTAIEDAANYKAKGGGVSADYFVDTFKKQGYNCLVLTDKKKIIKALKQGNNAVLIGRDLTNKSKRRSPFGSNDHYVLATGISSNEKIIYISDPEATDPDISYKTDIVMKGVRVAIIPITLNNKDTTRVNKSLSNALSVFVGRASAVDAINSASSTVKSTSTNPVLTQCAKFQTQFMKDKKAGIKWHYRNPGKYVSEQWSQALAKNKRCCNCALLARWALKEAGLISKNTFFYGKQDGTIQWSSSSKADVEKKCDVIKIGNKTVNQLEASGDLKPGDVVTYKGMRHTNIYAGNKHWYDAGHAYCSGSGEGATFTSWYGSQKYGGNTVGYIIRKKDNVSSNLGSLSSESLDSSTTGSTSDSGSTILDQLADALALLAQGWGLASVDDSSTENTYSDEGTGTTSSTAVTGKTAKAKIWNYLHAKGIPDNGIAGAMGNFQSESGNEFNRIQSDFTSDRTPSKAYTEQVNKGSVTKDQFIHGTPNINGKSYGPGYGLAQWTSYNRKKNLYEAAKKNKASIDDPQTSLDYLWKELQDPYYRPTLNAMKAGTSVRAVSDTFLKNFEQPGDQGDSVQQARANNGTTILKEMTGKGSGLSTSGISDSANKSIASINKSNSENNNIRDIKFDSVTGKSSGLSSTYSGDNSSTSSTSMPSVSFTQTRSQVSVNSNNNSSVNTTALLNAIINLLTQEVNNTASIQSIANAIVTLVDAKANDTSDVSTKKELLNTKQQIVSLMRRQNNDNASTSLGDLISSMEAIIAQ